MGRPYLTDVFFMTRQDTIKGINTDGDSLPASKIQPLQAETLKTASETDTAVPSQKSVLKKKQVTDSLTVYLHRTIQQKPAENMQEPLPQKEKELTGTRHKPTEKWSSPLQFASKLFSTESSEFTTYVDSLNSEKQIVTILKHENLPFLEKASSSTEWIIWTFILISILFLWIQVFYRKYLRMLFNSSVSYQISSKLLNEKNVLTRRTSFVLNFVYTLSLALFIFMGLVKYGYDLEEADKLSFFLIILNLLILYSIGKVILHKLTGFIFDSAGIVNEYLHNSYVLNKTMGIVLLPVTFMAFYSSFHLPGLFVFAGLIIILISLFMKIIRSFQIIIRNGVFIFYSILYLCTLEILPVLIGIKFLKTFI